MINLDSITHENNKKYNEKWPYIPDHPYRILIIGGSGSEKINTLLNSIKEQDYHDVIDKIPSKRDKKVLIVFDNMIADIMANKKFQTIIKELFIRCRKLDISLPFITQSYISVPKDVRVNSTHLIMKINNK